VRGEEEEKTGKETQKNEGAIQNYVLTFVVPNVNSLH